MALRSARARGGAGFFFELVLALVARDWFFLLVKRLCAPRGPEAGQFFLFRSSSLRSARARGRAGFFFKLVLALVARGSFLFRSNGFALRAGQRQGGVFRIPPPYLWTPLSPQRVKGCSPLTIPKMRSKPKNASRFAKRIFLCFSHLRLRRRFHVSAGLHALRGRNTSCEAANRRNEKNVQQRRPPPAAETGRSCWGRGQQDTSAAQGTKWSLGTATRLSEAASIFGLRQPLRGLKGASSPFLVGPCPCRAKHAAFASQTGLSA